MAITRRHVLATGALSLAAPYLMRTASAQEKAITVQIWGTTWANPMKRLSEGFTKETGIAVNYETQSTGGEGLVKLQAARARRQVDVWFTTASVADRAAADTDLFIKLPYDQIPNAAKLNPTAREERFVADAAYAIVIIYRPDLVKKAIGSWKDLWDPAYKGKIAVPNMQMFQGRMLLLCANLNGGGEKNIDKGFECLASIKPNIALFYASDHQARQMLGQGEVVAMVGSTTHAKGLIDQGVNVKIAAPRPTPLDYDGCMIVNNPRQELAAKYVNYVLRADVQEEIAKGRGVMPVNTEAKAPDFLTGIVPSATETMVVDEKVLNANMAEWTARFNREIAR